ncbi:uncharacterized protein E5676_scaffold1317G00150 [Cucumis melo var. makuwa]|uniref:Envelope-like protein n=1 Tax=Cucumis melo var. makuwa TaxID=1194695 RepID=A0A5D3C1J5_CUCMM|nr:uncharacterized protein E6C27_scaffold466G00790 [Cucumis melo var. makuwa]TYK05052.1 uncharacterized protein E5676_scaffold1317G00150 [Cucumis melo var. makuwa]
MTQPSVDAPEVTISSPPARQVKVRGRRFKSTPPRRSYRLPSKKSQKETSNMDSDDQDHVPLARLLKQILIPDVSNKLPVDPSSSIHSQEIEDEVEPQYPDIDTAEVSRNDDDNPAVPPTSADIPAASKPAEKKTQQMRCNITAKTDRKKIPPNIPSIPIDGISFHHKESIQRWKFVVQRRITDDVNVSDKHQFCTSIMDLIERPGLIKTISNVGPFYPQLI